MDRLKGKVAIVTGGGGGIGGATARALAHEGASVLVVDVNEDAAASVAGGIRDAGGVAESFRADLSEERDVEAVIADVVERLASRQSLHNNAALTDSDFLSSDTAVTELALEVWERTLAVNLTSQMLMCKHAVPIMADQGGGSIINMSSGRRLRGTARGPPTASRRLASTPSRCTWPPATGSRASGPTRSCRGW